MGQEVNKRVCWGSGGFKERENNENSTEKVENHPNGLFCRNLVSFFFRLKSQSSKFPRLIHYLKWHLEFDS
jgi:hypothetical protein